MTDIELAKVARQMADLRMQVNALQVAAKDASLTGTVKEARSTLRWAAVVIAAALIVSSALKLWGDNRVRALEQRVEVLEQHVR